MKGQRIHDSVFLKSKSELKPYTPLARLPGSLDWSQVRKEREDMLEIGPFIVLAQKYVSDLEQVTQENFAGLNDILRGIEEFISTSNSF